MSVNRSVEQFAFEVVRQVLDATVEEYDVGSRQSAVDGLIHYSDGRTAALEVSSIGPEAEARIINSLDGRAKRSVTGLRQTWFAEVPRDFHPADLVRIDHAVLHCEEIGATSLRGTLSGVSRELVAAGVDAWTSGGGGDRKPALYVIIRGRWGWEGAGASDLPEELANQLRGETMGSKIAKLRSAALAECHLFLHVRPLAFSFPVFNSLAFGGSLPVDRPNLPPGVSQVWLLSGWKTGGVVRAIAGERWLRHEIDDQASPTL
jgi:hypothetical protein